MTREDKQLLLQDLCARLPYGAKVKCPFDDEPYTLLSINWNKEIVVIGFMMDGMYVTSKQKLVDIKPYLRPMSSMTEEEKEELLNHVLGGEGVEYFHIAHDGSIDGNQEAEQDLYNLNLHWLNFGPLTTSSYIDWLNKNMFDFRGLIGKGLAILQGICDAKHEIEKQGKQTYVELSQSEVTKTSDQELSDKVGPKFHEGDWIVGNDGIFKITQYEDEYGYELTSTTGDVAHFISDDYVESNFNLWTIQDAKDGDVLVSGDVIFIFNKIHGVWVNCYCSLHKDGSFCEENYDLIHIKYAETIYPSTKEQRDTLFAKMKEAGYEWDTENKCLTKK